MKTSSLFKRFLVFVGLAQTAEQQYEIQPRDVPKRGSSEFYSTQPSQKLLMTVNIWGEVFQPGIHLIPAESTLSAAISAAGGPNGMSQFPSATLIRQGKKQEVNLIEMGDSIRLKNYDTIYVDRTIKSELPLYFGAISTIVSVLTLYYVTKK